MHTLSPARAHAARRASIAAAGVLSAIGAHVAAMGDLAVLPVAPALWAMFIGLAAVIGTRRAPFAARGLGVTALLVLASQMLMHVGMVAAPWAFGIAAHHAEPMLTPASAAAHVIAAVVLVALVAWGERLLAAVCAVAHALAAVGAAARPPGRPGLVMRTAPAVRALPMRGGFAAATPSRGPPVPA